MDLAVRGGTVHDGTGATARVSDVGVKDGIIVAIGEVAGSAEEEIDATGCIVTPGFVDIHTHYDGQAVWDDRLAPSSLHGVTTVVMGNCGVGFAPCRRPDHDALIDLMAGVEDIPAPVMAEGLTWDWETFPEYLDALGSRRWDVDVCAFIPHAPLRVYVMGRRALNLEPANDEDIAQMRVLVADGVRAGAFGISTSRATAHQSANGAYTPTLRAREAEITGLLEGLREAGRGVLQVVTEMRDPDVLQEYEMIVGAMERTGQPALFSLFQPDTNSDMWRELMVFADSAIERGISLRPVVAPRPMGLLLGLEGSQNPFSGTATYHKLRKLPLSERVAEMRKPEIRAQMLADDPTECGTFPLVERMSRANMFRLGNPPVYTPRPDQSLEAIAARLGRSEAEVAYDILLEDDGLGFILVPFANYFGGDPSRLSVCEEMLANPNAIMGLGDGGAHVGFILDAGFPTFLLTYWVRERGRFELSEAVRRLTSDTADAVGLADRGRLAVGLKADLNVINLDHLEYSAPYVEYDLPTGGKRLLQRSEGFVATVVSGEVTYRNGQPTSAHPGRLVRSSS
jgi:N-acyl-D-aspartate/D-glutamate deacylase